MLLVLLPRKILKKSQASLRNLQHQSEKALYYIIVRKSHKSNYYVYLKGNTDVYISCLARAEKM